ncbi:hypothetical protein TNCV_1193571 [Trichonephila clavipes]|nr:hypothetical protein TNCV_1193571 [Trichonephila clavipes]
MLISATKESNLLSEKMFDVEESFNCQNDRMNAKSIQEAKEKKKRAQRVQHLNFRTSRAEKMLNGRDGQTFPGYGLLLIFQVVAVHSVSVANTREGKGPWIRTLPACP